MKISCVGYCLLGFILVSIAGSVPAIASDFTLSDGEIGPIVVSTQMHIRDAKQELTAYPRQVAEFTATARNNSQWPIRNAKFCVQTGRRRKGCDFEFSNPWIWMPNEELTWMIDKHAHDGMEKVTSVILTRITVETRAAKQSH
jgi:hypothetical protein